LRQAARYAIITHVDERRRRSDWKGERVTISARAEPELHDTIAREAERVNMTINDYVLALLRHALNGEPMP
jgi:predicted HicB family RNase H-like nuclease